MLVLFAAKNIEVGRSQTFSIPGLSLCEIYVLSRAWIWPERFQLNASVTISNFCIKKVGNLLPFVDQDHHHISKN